MRLLILTIALFSTSSAIAEVYTLGVGGRAAIQDLMRHRDVLKEKMTVNDSRGEIEVYVLPQTMAEIYDMLKRFLPDATKLKGNSITVRTANSNDAERLMFVSMGERKKTVVYRLQTSQLDKGEPKWPESLPHPGGTIRQVTKLPNRGGVYGEAKIAGPAASIMRRYGRDLESNGWVPLAGASETGVYVRNDRMVVLAAESVKDGRWSVLGVYERKVKGKFPASTTRPAPRK